MVCIVSDGRSKVNSRTFSVLAAMGCYQEGVAKTKIGERDVTAHVYEYTTQISVTPSLKIENSVVPMQVIFCLKEKKSEENQLPSLVLQRFRTHPPTQCLCPA